MRIVYYLPSLHIPGGLERIITFKANYFADHYPDYQVYILTSEQMGKCPHFPLSSNVTHIDLGVNFDWPFNQSRISKLIKYPFRYMRFRQRFTRILKELKADIVISTLRREMNFIHSIQDGSVKIGEFHITRYAYHANALSGNNFLMKAVKKRLNNLFITNLQKFSRVILLTHEESGFWPELSNITVIPNPIITPTTCRTDNEPKQVIAVGRYVPQKGFDLLIKSWAQVSSTHPDWKLRIYGEGMRKELQEQIDQLGLNDTCILEHTVPDIQNKYCESSVFVLSSRYEGFGMVITEAMSCGVPPVSFACPCGPKDIIKDGEDGLLVENGNIEQLAEKICYLIDNKHIRKTMGNNAYENVKRFKMENISKQWDNLFKELIKK